MRRAAESVDSLA